MNKERIKICKYCNNKYEVPKSQHNIGLLTRKYCSYKCSQLSQIGKTKKTFKRLTGENRECINCQKKFYVQKNLLKINKGKYCSSKCLYEYKKSKIFGTDEHLRTTQEYKEWRNRVYERDNYTCFFCGIRGGKLNADHIKPFSLYPDLRFDVSNGRTLCRKCHEKTKTYGGRINPTKSIKNKDLKKRIIEISYKYKCAHLGSNLTAVDIIYEIFKNKKEDEKFLLSCGHAGIAFYVVLEKIYNINAEELFTKYGVHPKKDEKNYIWVTSGSLGCVLPIGLGMAISDRNKNIYCLVSDGESTEGSIYETLIIKQKYNINNLKIYLNLNGVSAYDIIDSELTMKRLLSFDKDIIIKHTNVNQLPFLNGIDAHYYVMNENDYKIALEILK